MRPIRFLLFYFVTAKLYAQIDNDRNAPVMRLENSTWGIIYIYNRTRTRTETQSIRYAPAPASVCFVGFSVF